MIYTINYNIIIVTYVGVNYFNLRINWCIYIVYSKHNKHLNKYSRRIGVLILFIVHHIF